MLRICPEALFVNLTTPTNGSLMLRVDHILSVNRENKSSPPLTHVLTVHAPNGVLVKETPKEVGLAIERAIVIQLSLIREHSRF